jgi:ribonuclease HI
LRIIAEAYKTILTKTLEIEIHIPPLDLFAEERVAYTFAKLLTYRTSIAAETAVNRIRQSVRGRRGRKATPNTTPATILRAWTEKRTGDLTRIEKRTPYAVPPWFPLPRTDVAGSKDEARRGHNSDSHKLRLRIYTDGSGLNNKITTSAISYNASHSGILSTINDAQMYHGEIADIKQAIRIFFDNTTGTDQLSKKTAIIYTDNQTTIRALAKEDPVKDQAIIRSILIAGETLAKRQFPLLLKWIPEHAKINGNKKADQRTKLSASIIEPMEKPVIRYLSAIRGLIRRNTTKK